MSSRRFENADTTLTDAAVAIEKILAGDDDGLEGHELRHATNTIDMAINMLSNLLDAAGLDWEDLEGKPDAARLLARALSK